MSSAADRLVEDVWDGRPPPPRRRRSRSTSPSCARCCPTRCSVRPGGVTSSTSIPTSSTPGGSSASSQQQDFGAALDLWRGEVLADLGELGFVVPERARLDELRLAAVEGRMEVALAGGRHAEVVGELAELVDAHPLRERLVALHLLALYRSGRQVEALPCLRGAPAAPRRRHRRGAGRRAAAPRGGDPRATTRCWTCHRRSPERWRLRSRCRRTEATCPLSLTSFVGRTHDVASCRLAVAERRSVTLTGPGGVGKTRLALEVAASMADELPGGAWLVDLAGVAAPDLVAGAVATTLAVDVRHALGRRGGARVRPVSASGPPRRARQLRARGRAVRRAGRLAAGQLPGASGARHQPAPARGGR